MAGTRISDGTPTSITGAEKVPIGTGTGKTTTTTQTIANLAAKLNQGTVYTEVGTLLDDTFPGVTLNSTNWSGGTLPTGATVNNKLIIASGANDWSRVIKLVKIYPHERETFEIYFKAVTKNSGDAWGITQNPTLLLFFNIPLYMKFDQGTGATSGMFSMGTTTAANEYGYSQPVTFAAGDQLKLTIQKKQGKTITQIQNLTTPTNPIAYGEFNVQMTSTGGQNWLSFLGGQQEFTEFKITSNERNFGSNSGVVAIGDSQLAGVGNTDPAFRWLNVLMRGETNLFVNLGISSWLTGTFSASLVTEFLTGINGKYLIITTGYNDAAQGTSTGTYQTNLQTIATTAQGMGYTVVFVSLVPAVSPAIDSTPYDTAMSAAATATSSHFINVRSALATGVNLNVNYASSDQVHINDAGCLVMANTIKVVAPDLYSQLMADFNTFDVRLYNLPFDNSSTSPIGIDHLGKVYRMDPSRYLNQNSPLLQSTTLSQQTLNIQTGSLGISGKLSIGDDFFQKNTTSQGLRINFNNGVNNTVGSNIIITNSGVSGTGTTPAFPNVSGLRNIYFEATSLKAGGFDGAIISGNDNLLINSQIATTLTANGNTVINVGSNGSALTGGASNIFVGKDAGKAVANGTKNIHLITANQSGISFPSTLASSMIFGEMSTLDTWQNNDVSWSTGESATAANFWFGGRETGATATFTLNIAAKTGTNVTGSTGIIRAARGTGTGESGTLDIQFSTPIGSGSTLHSAFTSTLLLSRLSATFGGTIKPVAGTTTLAPMQFTAAASLLTTPLALAVEPSVNGDYLNLTTTTGTIRRVIVAGSSGRATAQTALNNSVATYTLGATDASYEVSANVLVTTSSAENFTVTVSYTDEGNTARVLTLNFQTLGAVIGTAINFANGAVPYEGLVAHIRCKASTSITVKTTGTFTGATYNVEGIIKQTN